MTPYPRHVPASVLSCKVRRRAALRWRLRSSLATTEGGQPKCDSSPKKTFMYKKEPKEPISCSGQLEPTWRGPVAGGVLIYTHIGGYGFESRSARAFFVVGFWCFGAQVAARAKRRVVRGRTGGSCEFGGWPRVAYFPRFFSMRVLRFIMLGDCWGQKHGFRPRRTGSRAALEAVGFRVRRLAVGFCQEFFVFL